MTDWLMIIGQYLSAAATFWAVWISLNASKPDIKIKVSEKDSMFPSLLDGHGKTLCFSVVNKKRFILNLKRAAFYVNDNIELKYNPFYNELKEPSNFLHFEYNAGMLIQELLDKGCKGKIVVCFFVVDDIGKIYKRSFCLDLDQRKFVKCIWPKGKVKISFWYNKIGDQLKAKFDV